MRGYPFAWIGKGQLTASLLPAFLAAGHRCTGWWARNPSTATPIPSDQSLSCEALSEFKDRACEVVFLAVSDEAIAEVAAQLHAPKGVAFVHFSGTLPRFDGAGSENRPVGVCYPLQSFALPLEGQSIKEIPFLIESPERGLEQQLIALVKSLGAEAHLCTEKDRKHLHLAAVLINNFSNHLLLRAEAYLKQRGISFDLLRSLVSQTIRQWMSTHRSQSGPSRRGDSTTVRDHEALLKTEPTLLQMYRLFDQSIRETYGSSAEVDE